MGVINDFLSTTIEGNSLKCDSHDNFNSLAFVMAAISSAENGKRQPVEHFSKQIKW